MQLNCIKNYVKDLLLPKQKKSHRILNPMGGMFQSMVAYLYISSRCLATSLLLMYSS